jgi:Predicted Co/Zn/Cd cation transporters
LKTAQQNLYIQKWVAVISVLLLVIKFIAYYSTHSVAILTDAMESIVNVAAVLSACSVYTLPPNPGMQIIPMGMGRPNLFPRPSRVR